LATIQLEYIPHKFQRDFHLAEQRIKVCVCGARSGKTLAASHEFFDKCIRQPGYTQEDILTGKPYTVVCAAPTFRMMERVVMPQTVKIVPKELHIRGYHQTKNYMRMEGLKGETLIYFANASNPETWQGQELYGVWVDEFALIKETMFSEIETRVSNKGGWVLLTGTLRRGPGWAQKRIKDYAETEDGEKEVSLTQWNTSDNPYFPTKQLEYLRKTTPAKYFKRMYEACWDSFEGQIYDELNREVHLVDRYDYTFILPTQRRVGEGDKHINLQYVTAGVDWGHTHPGVIVVAGRDFEGCWYLLYEEYIQGLLVGHPDPTEDSWIKRARSLMADWDIQDFWADPEASHNIAMFQASNLPVSRANNHVNDGIMSLATLFHPHEETGEPRILIMSDMKNSIHELFNYHWEEDSLTGGTRERPVKSFDHTCDAIRYLIHSSITYGQFTSEPMYDA